MYKNIFTSFCSVIILILILSILLILLNQILFKLLHNQKSNQERIKNKGLETYEFGTHSVGLISTIGSNQIFVLAIIFLLFDIEIIFLVPWIINVENTWALGNSLMLIFCNFILYSFMLELYFGLLVWYKNKKIKYL